MININKSNCIGCGICIKDCPVRCILVVDEKADVNNNRCMKCGHCIAICPTNAVSSDEYDMSDVVEHKKEAFDIEPDRLLNFIKFRRSIRQFKDKDVEDEKIKKIIDAGRFTQTSTNSQDVSYIVVKDKKEELRELVLEGLNDLGNSILSNLNDENKKFEGYAKSWIKMYQKHKENPNQKDRIFFDAPVVILVVSKTPVNGALASTNMELMTNTLGLGTFYSGFLVRASQANNNINAFLGLDNSNSIITALVVGYPDVKYQRTVPRKDAQIAWI